MRRLACPVVTLTLVLVPICMLLAQPRSPGAATLKFAWPVGTSMLVDTEYRRWGSIDPPVEVSRLRMTHRVRVLPHVEGRLIKQSDQRYVESSGDFLQAVTSLLWAWIPSIVVNADGGFRRFEDTAELQNLVIDVFKSQLPLADTPAIRDHLKQMLSGEGLTSIGIAEWRRVVGQWTGMAVTPELTEVMGSTQPMPGVAVPTKTRIGLIARSACARGKETFDCVTYQYHQSITPEALKTIVDALQSGASATSPSREAGLRYRDYEMLVQVTMETDTMLPHEFIQTRSMHGTAELNGDVITTTDIERRHSTFIYDDK